MNSASIAISTNANIQASIAAARAAEAERIACMNYEKEFDSKTATIVQKKQYADCIRTLYPNELSAPDLIGLKIAFVLCLIGMVYGAWTGEDLLERVLHALVGFAITGCVLAVGFLLFSGIAWLFS